MIKLIIDNNKILKNYNSIRQICDDRNLVFLPVTKCIKSDKRIVMPLIKHQLPAITDVQINNLSQWDNISPTALLSTGRSILKNQYIPDIIYTTDPLIINELSKKNDKVKFILQLEMGGLREGIVPDLFDNFMNLIDKNNYNRISGFSTNYGCIHGIVPDPLEIKYFTDLSVKLADKIGISNPIIAAGGTILYDFLINKQLPSNLTHIRMGESILFGFNTYTNSDINELEKDIFKLQAEIIEVKEVNTNIKGNNNLNIYGEVFDNSNKLMSNGIRKRAIVNFGSMIGGVNFVEPSINNIIICGQSYDHTVLDITECSDNLKTGDFITFKCKYDCVVKAFHNPYATIEFKGSN